MTASCVSCREDELAAFVDSEEDTEEHEEQPETEDWATAEDVSEAEETEFDACPDDTYFLWEVDGVRYEITIPVFCEPIQDLNLGCPAPF